MRAMCHPDYRYTPWSEERRRAASERAKARAAREHETMSADWPMTASTAHGFRRAKRKREEWTPEDRRKLSDLWCANIDGPRIAEILERPITSIYSKVAQMGLPKRQRGGARNFKRTAQASRKRKADPSGQRRFHGVEQGTGVKITLEPHDPRYRAGTTVFPTQVFPASKLGRLLKSGHNSRKIGKEVAKGNLRGAPIFTLTLEERATCPRSCAVWPVCYGNNMPFAQRIFDDGTLTKRLWGELASIQADNSKGFLVRLHVLGDFYSPEYVAFWRSAFDEFPGLNVFGFTARRPPDPVGVSIVELVRDHYERCHIRFSGLDLEEDGSVVIGRKEDAIGILCPAESDPDRCCATCALCWHTNKTISFLRH